ncbi:phosphate acetyltransferase [Tsukamurella asaccharolytica]|uniref:Phosphate acetyltransferase n=1 Tax=Tsukamurella asaccharolytica TaxID=2592067 RepID=A0A5C5RG34_9ACTN|nr:phosphate acetyltransferase [Tsukamurella asaccharolytica]TWS21373.1 phosphate acetyltransferase [Tsukamurella asaccharolytica]
MTAESVDAPLAEADRTSATANVYVTGADQDSDVSAVALGIVAMLSNQAARVGVFQPIASERGGSLMDLLREYSTVKVPPERSIGVTSARAALDPKAALAEIVQRYGELAQDCDAILILGTDEGESTPVVDLRLHGAVAANLGAPVVLVVSANARAAQDVGVLAERSLNELRAVHAHPVAVIATRVVPNDLTDVGSALSASLDTLSWAIPESPAMRAPTVNELVAAVNGTVIAGDPALLSREAMGVLVGGGAVERALENLSEGAVVIVPADRTDYLLALTAAHGADRFPTLAGLILNGGVTPHPAVADLLEAMNSTLPVIATDLLTFDTAQAVTYARGRLDRNAERKIDLALAEMDRHVDGDALLERLRLPIPDVVTPQRFEHGLLQRAKQERKHVVLPEGSDDRILRAAGRLLQRDIASLTVLGSPEQMTRRAAELGVDLSEARLIDPERSELRELFGQEFARLRAHKGMTEDRAYEMMGEVTYFGTMMVHLDYADAMVSGAAHTTAATMKPVFEIIKTEPGISTASSVIFMCLADQVLAFSDCVVVRNPTAEELADIAIASAGTAAQFGLDPRLAMLSYSTGTSGIGADVDKVRAATELVRERRPDIAIEGPIQYDAALYPEVAATKMPDSPVAGRATVLIFPDLNTGNNTVKAVQRTAGGLMIGPAFQGLRKPINDLSRGARVEEIVNTVAITAIQAQSRKPAQDGVPRP